MPKQVEEPRHVAVSIVVSPSTRHILMITSRAHPDLWILPKGGIEDGESSGQAAVREAWEEAGTPPTLRPPTDDERLMMLSLPSKKKRGSVWHVHVLEVEQAQVDEVQEWPESGQRKRAWYTPSECLDKIQEWYADASLLREEDIAAPAELGPGEHERKATTHPAGSEHEDKKRKKKAEKGGAMERAVRHLVEVRGW